MNRRLLLAPLGLVTLLTLGLACNLTTKSGQYVDDDPAPPPSLPVQSGPQPVFGPVVEQATPPPAISGGTLGISPDGRIAVASDPDRGRVHLVDLDMRTARSVAVGAAEEPGRVTFDEGRAWVAMRSSGDVVAIDLATFAIAVRAHACASPRGIAFEKATGLVHVACAEGEIVSISRDGAVARRVPVDRDVRDIVVRRNGELQVSVFRSAEILRVDPAGALLSRARIGASTNMAWRLLPPPPPSGTGTPGNDPPEDEPVATGQSASDEAVQTSPGGYGSGSGPCARGIVASRMEMMGKGSVLLPQAVLPVDVATNGREYVAVAAGNGHTKQLPQLFIVQRTAFVAMAIPPPSSTGAAGSKAPVPLEPCAAFTPGNVPGQAVAAAFDGKDRLIVQSREPAALYVMTEDRRRVLHTIELATESREDTGHAVFHSNAGAFVACASCHGEGGDDGRTWKFVGLGARRTPSLKGTVAHTEPFHWSGDQKDMADLAKHVFVERMSGPELEAAQTNSLQRWVFAIPAPARPAALTEAAQRGKTQFEARGCAGCHSGAMLTNNQTVDVGTGGPFQVPSLVGVASHAPFLHDGCAKTLEARFVDCGGGARHGNVAGMSDAERADLVRYLEAL
jgi:cytochrome c peroxidase